jgi:hypothetical protein
MAVRRSEKRNKSGRAVEWEKVEVMNDGILCLLIFVVGVGYAADTHGEKKKTLD